VLAPPVRRACRAALFLMLVADIASLEAWAATPVVLDGPLGTYSGDDQGYADYVLRGLPPTNDLRAQVVATGHVSAYAGEAELRADGSTEALWGLVRLPTGMRPEEFLRLSVVATADDGLPLSLQLRNAAGRLECPTNWSTTTATGGCNHVFRVSELTGSTTRESTSRDTIDLIVAPSTRRRTRVYIDAVLGITDITTRTLQVTPKVSPSGTSRLRFAWDDRMWGPDSRIAHVVEVRDGARPIRGFMLKTFGHAGRSFAPLSPRMTATDTQFSLAGTYGARRFLNGVPIIIPDNGAAVTIDVAGTLFSAASPRPPADLRVELYRGRRDPAHAAINGIRHDASPDVVIDDEPASNTGRSRERRTIPAGTLAPGVWYVRPVSALAMHLDVNVSFGSAARGNTPRFGHYFNPHRPGHGFSLSPAGGDWVLIWYAYDDDDLPTWYYAQARRPLASTRDTLWSAPLWRVAWDGERSHFADAGHVQLSSTGGETLEMTWTLDGIGGSEPMVPLGPTGCAQSLNGVALDVNGQWYSPLRSGFGYSVQMIRDQEFHLAYLYDGEGLPRWITAQDRFTSVARSIVALQVAGFCPSCDATPTTSRAVGWLSREFSTVGGTPRLTTIGAAVDFTGPVVGGWRQALPTDRLGAPFGCR